MKKVFKNSLRVVNTLLLIGLSFISMVSASAQKDKDTYQKQIDEHIN
ncbi:MULTISPECIES: hypothetical protein [Runella]|uniref:Uncharacterized protein n=1 Tax=Runella defluvii TaxID=370973 RepID=A0A7W5ZRS0_9BACT|nr:MULTISPECIES: hypothetical protein [Runella]MBB3840866.1 hypothetical protein [Runella defluvii]